MRICEINDIASVATDLTRGLEARGHSVTIIQPKLVGGQLPGLVKPVVGPVRAVEWAQIIHQVKTGAFDIVHIHYAYLGMLGILGHFPYILHCHGSDVRELTPFTRPLTERAIAGASHVYYATPDLASYVVSRRSDAQFLPNPVDSQLFRPFAPANQSNRVLVCCSLTDIKGAFRILEACRQVAARRPEIQVTAIAGGEWTAAFRELPNVTLIRHQPRANLPQIISEHGVVVGQVLLGVVGMAEFEAMACARPVVSWFTYDRAYPERPPIVRAVDGFDIAAAIIRLVDDPAQRAAIGEASRAWVTRHHGVGCIAEQVECTASRVIAGVDRAPART